MEKNKEEQYRKEAEWFIRDNPKFLLRRIKSIVFWSYVYFVFILLLSFFLTIFAIVYIYYLRTIGIWIILIAGGTMYSICKGLFFSVKTEEEYTLSPEKYPELFGLIRELEQKLSVRIHKVYLDSSLNMGVIQRPRLGIFGYHENILTIGLQMLVFLSKEEVVAILAHELTHISNQDGKSTNGVFRIRRSWLQMIFTLSNQKRLSAKPIMWFLEKTWPRLDVYTFAYSRYSEQKADAFAIKYAGIHAWAEMLVKVHISKYSLDVFWKDFEKESLFRSEPPNDAFEQLVSYIAKPIDQKKIKEWIAQAAFEYTRTYDTHPALEDRLLAQKVDPTLNLAHFVKTQSSQSAAQFYLGANYNDLLHYFNMKIFNHFSKNWKDVKEYERSLNEIIKSNPTQVLTEEERWKKISVQVYKHGIKSIETQINEILIKDPEQPQGLYYKGLLLLENNDSKGERILLDLITMKKASYEVIYEPLYLYYSRNNMRDKARDLETKLESEHMRNRESLEEVNKLSQNDHLVPHDLSEEVLQKIRDCGIKSTGIASISVAKKNLKSDFDIKTYVVTFKEKWWHMYSSKEEGRVIKELREILPMSIVFLQRRSSRYARKIKKVNNSKVYKAGI